MEAFRTRVQEWCKTVRDPNFQETVERSSLCDRGFQPCEQSRPPPQLCGEGFDRTQRGRADVMLHPLHIVINHAIVQAEKFQKISQELMPVCNLAREGFAGCS